MTKIEYLRNELHKTIDNGNYDEILIISRKLDKEILKELKRNINYSNYKKLHI